MKIKTLSPLEVHTLIDAVRLDRASDSDRDEMAIPTYLHPNPLIRWLFWRRYTVVGDLCAFTGSEDVLEFGCGIGAFLPSLCAAARCVSAIDLFPEYARHLAHSRGLAVQFPAVLSDVPDASLDRVIAADVMEHLDDPLAYLHEFQRVLRPGGLLLVSGPTESFVYKIGRLAAGYAGKGDYHHTNIYHLEQTILGDGWKRHAVRALPFWFPPHLFRVNAFIRR